MQSPRSGRYRCGHLESPRKLRFEADPQPAGEGEVSREFCLERGGPTRYSGSSQKVGIQIHTVLPPRDENTDAEPGWKLRPISCSVQTRGQAASGTRQVSKQGELLTHVQGPASDSKINSRPPRG